MTTASKRALGTRVAAKIRQWARNLTDPYQPELHYMRGPGPKWHEKHGETAQLTAQPAKVGAGFASGRAVTY